MPDPAPRAGDAPSAPEAWDAFFNEFYLRAYADPGRDDGAGRDALAAVRLAGCPGGGDVIDVPCGFGRHALPLAGAGYRVTGVDRSQALLDEAARRAGGDGDGDGAPRLVRADYRDLPFGDACFDVALNLFTSLGYLGDEEDTRALAEICRVLRPEGRLVVETMHRDALVSGFQEDGWRALGGGRLLLEQRAFDAASGVAQTTQTLIDRSGARDSRTFAVRVYSATELVAMLRRAGFGAVRCHGDLAGGPLHARTRLVVVARR